MDWDCKIRNVPSQKSSWHARALGLEDYSDSGKISWINKCLHH